MTASQIRIFTGYYYYYYYDSQFEEHEMGEVRSKHDREAVDAKFWSENLKFEQSIREDNIRMDFTRRNRGTAK